MLRSAANSLLIFPVPSSTGASAAITRSPAAMALLSSWSCRSRRSVISFSRKAVCLSFGKSLGDAFGSCLALAHPSTKALSIAAQSRAAVSPSVATDFSCVSARFLASSTCVGWTNSLLNSPIRTASWCASSTRATIRAAASLASRIVLPMSRLLSGSKSATARSNGVACGSGSASVSSSSSTSVLSTTGVLTTSPSALMDWPTCPPLFFFPLFFGIVPASLASPQRRALSGRFEIEFPHDVVGHRADDRVNRDRHAKVGADLPQRRRHRRGLDTLVPDRQDFSDILLAAFLERFIQLLLKLVQQSRDLAAHRGDQRLWFLDEGPQRARQLADLATCLTLCGSDLTREIGLELGLALGNDAGPDAELVGIGRSGADQQFFDLRGEPVNGRTGRPDIGAARPLGGRFPGRNEAAPFRRHGTQRRLVFRL